MEPWLIRIADYLLAQSWQIAVLTMTVALASFALRNRSAHVRYLLWLIVLAKALVPPLYSIPVAVLPQNEPPVSGFAAPRAEPMDAEYRVPEIAVPESPRPAAGQFEAVSLPQATKGPARYDIRAWLAVGWLAGAAALAFYYLLNALRTQIWLQRRRTPLPNHSARAIESFFAAHGVRRMPRVWLLERISQPFVWGLVRGSIYLPARLWHGHFGGMAILAMISPTGWKPVPLAQDGLGRDCFHGLEARATFQASLLGHELCHVIRLDAMVNSLQVIAQTVFWFHPCLWWANAKIRAEREKCCDEMTIARLNTRPEEYGEAIVETLAAKYEQVRPVPSLAVAGQIKNIEERINTMLRPGKKFYKHPSLIAATVVLVIALLTVPTALVLTARAQTEAPKPETKSTHPLHEAALAGDIEGVKSLISKGADVNEKDQYGRTALHCASWKGHAEVADLLISRGARINVTTAMMASTPLHFAATRGDKQTVKLLLSKGASTNAKKRDGSTPLFEAMKSTAAGSKELVELLVAEGAKVPALHLAAYMGDIEKLKKCLQDGTGINSQEDFGCTALHAAANSDKKDIVEFLISKGAKVDARDTFGLAPLYYAALHNDEDIADLLLGKGADVNAKDKDRGGFTLLNYAIWDHSKDAANLLISKGANVNVKCDTHGWTPLFYATWENDKDMAELLISKGADVKAQDKQGLTPLDWAVKEGYKDLVELLTPKGATPVSTIHLAAREGDLEKVKRFIVEGADINAKNEGGETPLFSAISADKNDVVRFLITKGADVNARVNQGGLTPLHEACVGSPKDVIELLIAKGADVNAKTQGELAGLTPLHVACRRGQKDVAELLIAKGADLNAKITSVPAALPPMLGYTPLHLSSTLGHKDVVELLIAKGADIDIQNSNGRTPLHEACSTGRKDVVELLITKGADINARDNKEQTPLSLAKERGHKEIAEMLRQHGAKE